MMSAFMRRVGPGLIAGLAILPGAVAVCITFFYLGDWPTENPFDQVFYGALAGGAFWIVVSLAFLRGFADVESADPATFDELVVRKDVLIARLHALGGTTRNPDGRGQEIEAEVHADEGAVQEPSVVRTDVSTDAKPVEEVRTKALKEAGELLAGVTATLAGSTMGSTVRWSGASGYISLWRRLHRAEEALLAAESKETLYAEAVDDEGRLVKTRVDGAETLLGELRSFLREPAKERTRAQIVAELDQPVGRMLLRKIRFCLNSYRDDLFQRFVRIRNAMFATLVYVGLVGDGVLALAILALPRRFESAVVAGMTYYLVGALVGLFAELYGASRGHRGAVHDYGLALVRLLTIPVLSGIAAVLGVVLTRLGGAALTDDALDVPLEQIFSLAENPLSIVVAAIFGLTPGLLLERLRAETNEYKEELMKSSPGTPSASASSSPAT
jgi:hypothetical protein